MIERRGEGGSAWLTPPLGGINSSLKEREREILQTSRFARKRKLACWAGAKQISY